MKNNNRRKLRPFTFLYFFALLLSCFVTYPAAATIVTANNSATAFSPYRFQSMSSINCDMIDHPGDGKLFAVVYNGVGVGGTPRRHLYIEYTGTSGPFTYDISLRGSSLGANADVAILDDWTNTLGKDYLITVVYEDNGNVMMDTYPVTGIGTGSPAYTGGWSGFGGNPKQLNGNGNSSGYPHIDAGGDLNYTATISGNTSYALINFAITWEEQISSVQNIMVNMGTILVGDATTSLYSANSGGAHPDIALRTWKTLTGLPPVFDFQTAYVCFFDISSSNLMIGELVQDNTFFISAQSTAPLDNSSNGPSWPRIDAKTIGDVVTGEATWDIAYDPMTGTQYEVRNFTDVAPAPTTTVCTLSSTNDHIKPIVAGTGQDICVGGCATAVGTDFYTVSYYTDYSGVSTNGDFFANSIDLVGGGLSGTYPDFYQINLTNTLNTAFSFSTPLPAMGSSTSTNNGDAILTAWFEGNTTGGGFLVYKIGDNTYSGYKTSSAIKNINIEKDYKILPNPATEQLTVIGAVKATYTITDMLGRTVGNGAIDAQHNNIAVVSLTNGVYMLHLTENGYTQKVKFMKQ
jgi:hypothetical protein